VTGSIIGINTDTTASFRLGKRQAKIQKRPPVKLRSWRRIVNGITTVTEAKRFCLPRSEHLYIRCQNLGREEKRAFLKASTGGNVKGSPFSIEGFYVGEKAPVVYSSRGQVEKARTDNETETTRGKGEEERGHRAYFQCRIVRFKHIKRKGINATRR